MPIDQNIAQSISGQWSIAMIMKCDNNVVMCDSFVDLLHNAGVNGVPRIAVCQGIPTDTQNAHQCEYLHLLGYSYVAEVQQSNE